MLELLTGLFDTNGFPPRKACGTAWTPGLIGLHALSDLFIWLAYVSIPLVLLHFTRRRDLPFPRLFLLFAVFILACGTTHLIDALIFEFPIYRFAGVMKLITAVVSWATVIALVSVVPRVMQAVTEAGPIGDETKPHRPLAGAGRQGPARDYIIAVLAGVLAVLVRAALEPITKGDHIFVVPLLAVVYVSWQCGFRPGVVCLLVALGGYTVLFAAPRASLTAEGLGEQLAVALFFFCGVACAALGESQRTAQRQARDALTTAVARREELESEVVRRRVVEAALRQREGELVAAQRETAETLARLNAFLDNAPLGIAFFDPDLRFVRINTYLAEANGKPVEEHTGRPLAQVLPGFPADLVARYRHTAGENGSPFTAQVRGIDARRSGAERVWQVTAFPVRVGGRNLGAGVVAQDVTDRLRAEDELRRSERNLADFFENANVGLHWIDPSGVILRANTAELELLGYAREEYVGRPAGAFHTDPHAVQEMLARLKSGEQVDNYPARLRCKDGGTREVLVSASGLWEDGRFVHGRCFTRDVSELKRKTDELANQARVSALRADVAAALAASDETRTALRACAETLVRSLGAAFARVWTADPSGEWLELQASAGLYTHTDGPHARVRVGQFKIGRIAHSRAAHLTNDVPNDPNVSDPAWAVRERMRAFAGYPLVVEGRLLGVVALFSRTELSDALLIDLGLIAASIAQYVDRRRTIDALRESEERYRVLTEAVPHIVWNADARGEMTYFNRRWLDYTALPVGDRAAGGWTAAVHPDDRARVAAAWERTVTAPTTGGGDRFNHEFRLREARTGAYRWFLSVAVPLRQPDGRVDRWIGSMADIHDQKTAAEAIRQSEAFRHSMFQNSPDALKVLDTDGSILEINAAGCRLLDLDSPDQVVGRPWEELWPAVNRGTVREAVAAARAGEPARFQGFCPTATGAPRYWDVSVAPLPGADGTPHRLMGVSRDVTEQRRAEERVRESEELFRQLAESIPQLAWMTDPEGNIFWYNQRWYDYTGTTFDEVKGWGWRSVHDPAELPRVVDKFNAHLASREPWEDTFPLRGRDGRYRWFLSRARPMRDPTGAVVRWIGTNTDVSAQRDMELALRASEYRFRTLTEAVPQMVWTADPAGAVTFFNRRWAEYTGLQPGAAPDGWAGAVHPEDEAPFRAAWSQSVAHPDGGFARELRLRRGADGQFRWMLAVAVPLRDAAGGVSEWVGTLTDIDDQKRQTELLERLVRARTAELEGANAALTDQIEVRKAIAAELERSNAELEKFAYIASHDLQEPLRKIQAFGDRLRNTFRAQLADPGKEYVDRMLSAAGRMRRLIDDLLTFSRVTTHQRPFVRLDLGKLVREVVSDLEVRIDQEKGTVVVGALGAIEADVSQMRQLFQNLIANAVKFHRPGVPPVVEILGEPAPEAPGAAGAVPPVPLYRVIVRDNGIGFEDKYRERIFDVFQRLHGRDEYEGTGVGLAICRKIVERHGGTITARGRPGEGATFVVALPVRRATTQQANAADEHPDQTDHRPGRG
jgi:PAS domain S-box-containing protein